MWNPTENLFTVARLSFLCLTFISMLLLDGVFERHLKLRGAAVELGAGWVPELLRHLEVTTPMSKVDAIQSADSCF